MKIEYLNGMTAGNRTFTHYRIWLPILEEFSRNDKPFMKITEFNTHKNCKSAVASVHSAIKHYGFPMQAHLRTKENAVHLEDSSWILQSQCSAASLTEKKSNPSDKELY